MYGTVEDARNKLEVEFVDLLKKDGWLPYVVACNALDSACYDWPLSDTQVKNAVFGLVWVFEQFPFSMSWKLGKNHFVKSLTQGLVLYEIENPDNLKLRQINRISIVATINENRTGWKIA